MNSKIKYIKKEDVLFPKSLKELHDCPDILYVAGNEKILNDFGLAIIGARKCSYEGKDIARQISRDLTSYDISIISGLAVGIDSIAQETCVDCNGKTIAVLGCGFFNLYPKENISLFHKIIERGGAIISEYPPNEYPSKLKFHNRNRIIAALSSGVIVIEARERSGSLVTVKFAKELNKNIFVVPGSIENENYRGTNKLLCNGEKCVLSADDIIKYYPNIIKRKKATDKKEICLNKDLQNVYNSFKNNKLTVDEICNKTGEDIKSILRKLTILEMQGYVVQYPGKIFSKK